MGSIPGSGRSLEQSNPFQYSCLENPMDRRTWRATVHGVTKSQTRLKRQSTHAQTNTQSLFSRMFISLISTAISLSQTQSPPHWYYAYQTLWGPRRTRWLMLGPEHGPRGPWSAPQAHLPVLGHCEELLPAGRVLTVGATDQCYGGQPGLRPRGGSFAGAGGGLSQACSRRWATSL